MFRRITLAIQFKSPDPILRKMIWKKHFPQEMTLSSDIDFDKLSVSHELTGGLIKNAIISALSFAVARNNANPVITGDDLEKSARLQMRGNLSMTEFEKRIVPTRGMNDLVVPQPMKHALMEVVTFQKARKILYTQWGFDEKSSQKQGVSVLLYGPSGSGKSLAAEVIGFEWYVWHNL